MKKLICPLTCLVLLLTNIGRCDELPFFSSLRAEIANQLTIVSNTVPLDKKLAAALRTNLKLIDRTKPTLVNGTTALGTLAKNLGKTSLSNTFLPILMDTRSTYIDAMETETGALQDRLAGTIPGKVRIAAQVALDKLSAALDDAGSNPIFTASLTSLKKAATAVGAAQKAVTKAESAPPGASFLSATITESNQGVTTFKPVRNTILEAYYDEFSGEIVIDAGELKGLVGGRVQLRYLEITAAVPGEGTHTLSLTNGAYAIYERIVAPNIREFEEEEPDFDFYELYFTIDPINESLGTGTVTITVDFDANVVWGEFTFTATGSEDSNLQVSMTGTFFVRLEVFDDEEDDE